MFCSQIVNFYSRGCAALKKLISIVLALLSFVACAGLQTMTPEQVSDEVSRINQELPQKINDNTTLERVSYNENNSVMVCYYTVESWDEANVVARKQSKHLFCEMIDQEQRKHLFSMADTIELKYSTADGWMQYEFVADKGTCNE
jgi:hypothetical protein